MREVLHQLRRGLLEHGGTRSGLGRIIDQAVDAPMADVIAQAIAIDHLAQVGAGPGPVALLDDAVVQVADVEAAIRTGRCPHRAERGIGRGDEFALRVGIDQHALAIDHLHLAAADQASYRLRQDVIAQEVGRQAVPAVDRLAGAAGDVVERADDRLDPSQAALHVDDLHAREDFGEIIRLLPGQRQRTVAGMLLESEYRILAAGGRAVEAPHVIHRQPPLGSAAIDRIGRPHQVGADAEAPAAGLRGIDEVVGAVEQGAVLMLEVGARWTAIVDHDMLIGDPIAILVLVGDELAGVGLGDHHAIIQRQHHARQHEVVDIGGRLVIDAIALGIGQHRDARFRLILALGIRIGHVGAHLAHQHAAIAIPGEADRIDDHRLLRNHFDMVAGRKLEHAQRFLHRRGGDQRFHQAAGIVLAGLLAGGEVRGDGGGAAAGGQPFDAAQQGGLVADAGQAGGVADMAHDVGEHLALADRHPPHDGLVEAGAALGLVGIGAQQDVDILGRSALPVVEFIQPVHPYRRHAGGDGILLVAHGHAPIVDPAVPHRSALPGRFAHQGALLVVVQALAEGGRPPEQADGAFEALPAGEAVVEQNREAR